MPNHSYNHVHFAGPKATLEQLADTLRSEDNVFDLNNIIPAPEGIGDGRRRWNCDNWWTKWNTYEGDMKGLEERDGYSVLKYFFITAWAPPVPVLKRIYALFPDVEVFVHADIEGDHEYTFTIPRFSRYPVDPRPQRKFFAQDDERKPVDIPPINFDYATGELTASLEVIVGLIFLVNDISPVVMRIHYQQETNTTKCIFVSPNIQYGLGQNDSFVTTLLLDDGQTFLSLQSGSLERDLIDTLEYHANLSRLPPSDSKVKIFLPENMITKALGMLQGHISEEFPKLTPHIYESRVLGAAALDMLSIALGNMPKFEKFELIELIADDELEMVSQHGDGESRNMASSSLAA